MKLSAKIGSGFGALIVIACILGGLSVYNMLKVKNVAQRMVDAAVPAMEGANGVEKNFLIARYDFRGFQLTGNFAFNEKGQKSLAEVMRYLDLALKHAEDQDIPELRDAALAAQAKTKEYADLANQSEKAIQAMASELSKRVWRRILSWEMAQNS